MLIGILLCVLLLHTIAALENGLARTPPMGWMSWERFRCNLDCVNDPDNCIGEKLYYQMGKAMAKKGYLDAGYNFISIDDCWMLMQRAPNGSLVADPKRFPSGIPSLAEYIHSLGLHFGIYEDIGTKTCGGYPGSEGYEKLDAETFASWNVDYLKLDGCYKDPSLFPSVYPLMGKYLNDTGRHITYSCSWPAYLPPNSTVLRNYTLMGIYCNLWRNYDDIQDSWESVLQIVDYFASMQDYLIPTSGPGHWHDPDMLIIGNYGLSYDQSKAQMALWAIMAAPLIMSNDLRTIRPEYAEILLNKDVIAIDQDPMGIMGRRIIDKRLGGGIEVWKKPIIPVIDRYSSYALVFLNRRTDGMPTKIQVILSKLGLNFNKGYLVQELFTKKNYGFVLPDESLFLSVNPTGVVMIRCILNTYYKPFNYPDDYFSQYINPPYNQTSTQPLTTKL